MALKEGTKYDAQKPRWSLLPTRAIQAVVGVLEYGARKYTAPVSRIPCDAHTKLADYCTCQNNSALQSVTPNDVTPQKGSAPPATKRSTPRQNARSVTRTASHSEGISAESATTESSRSLTPLTRYASVKITTAGSETTKSGSKSGPSHTTGSPESNRSRDKITAYGSSQHSGSQSKTNNGSSQSRGASAPSASSSRSGLLSTSTTITQPASSEGSCVGGVTKESASWETVSKALLEHSPTCHVRAVLEVRDEALWRSGAGNWRKVENARTRYYDAAMRHIHSWWLGEQIDAESGQHHLAHAICCLVFLLAVEVEQEST